MIDLFDCGEILAEQTVALRHHPQSANFGRSVGEIRLSQILGAPDHHHTRTPTVLFGQTVLLLLSESEKRHTVQSDDVFVGRVGRSADESESSGSQRSQHHRSDRANSVQTWSCQRDNRVWTHLTLQIVR